MYQYLFDIALAISKFNKSDTVFFILNRKYFFNFFVLQCYMYSSISVELFYMKEEKLDSDYHFYKFLYKKK